VIGPLVLVGSPDDDHVKALTEAVRERGVEPVLLDSLRFPDGPRLAMAEDPEDTVLDGRPLGRPAAVYLRSLYLSPLAYLVDVSREMEENWSKTMVIFQEKGEMLVGLLRRWEALQVPIYNPLTASDAVRKPYQIAALGAAGLPVPETLWTNDPDAVRRFAAGRRIAYKPVRGGASTRELKKQDLDDRRLSALANAPVCFQELLPGEDLRYFVLDGRVAAAFRIEADSLDYRQHEQRVESLEPEPDIAAMCVRGALMLKLRFTGIDLKRGSDGRLRFLEMNPSPMFLGFDQWAGTNLLGQVADALVAHAKREP
jgi:glutathione synthase/RimK-type ligase-like ATP-grasp enzyme